MTPDSIVAIGTLFTAIGAMVMALWTLTNAARKEEITRLQTRLQTVENENSRLHRDILKLRAENLWLRLFLSNKGLAVPPMPKDEGNSPDEPG